MKSSDFFVLAISLKNLQLHPKWNIVSKCINGILPTSYIKGLFFLKLKFQESKVTNFEPRKKGY